MLPIMKRCAECRTELEIHIECGLIHGIPTDGIKIWYCQLCKAGCGELTNEELLRYR